MIRKISAVILLVLGLGLILYSQLGNLVTAHEQNAYSVNRQTASNYAKNNRKKGNFDYASVKPATAEDIAKKAFDNKAYPAVGGISIPALKLNLPIFKGVGYEEMMFGAGTMKADQVMGQGNYALASHNVFDDNNQSDGKKLFSPLIKAKVGQTIYLTDKQSFYVYKVTSIDTVSQYSVDVVDDVPGENRVTLITCLDLAATKRIIVVGELNQVEKYDNHSAQYFENK